MPKRNGPVHVVTITRQYRGKTYRTHLLRRSFREGSQVRNETLGNLSHLPDSVVELIRRALKGETLVPDKAAFEIESSRAHGPTQAVLAAMRRLEIDQLLSSTACREQRVVLGMIAARIIQPRSKLSTTRWWKTTTLPDELGIRDATEEDLYDALDWLIRRQARIEGKLAARHLKDGELVLYDVTSTYFEGRTCPLAAYGHSRDGKRGKLQIVFGLLCSAEGRPIAVEIFKGNTADPKTLASQVRKVVRRFGLKRVVMVGDRGMITEARIREDLRPDSAQLDWVTALRAPAIRRLADEKSLDLSLFDERNLIEIRSDDFPGERLVVCRNPLLADERARKRDELLAATERSLDKIRQATLRPARPLRGRARIGLKVGAVLNHHKMGKHFRLEIRNGSLRYERKEDSIERERSLDGVYVIRTSVPEAELSREDVVRTYKRLSRVERAFRNLKTIQLKVRPIFHAKEDRVRAHVFLCMLAYYVEWHMEEAWRELLFSDEALGEKRRGDPVAPAQRSESALRKATTKKLDNGTDVHSFATLLAAMGTIVRNVCRPAPAASSTIAFDMTTSPDVTQRRALELLETITV